MCGIAAEAEARTAGAPHASAADCAGEGGGNSTDAAAGVGALVGTAADLARAQIQAHFLHMLRRLHGADVV